VIYTRAARRAAAAAERPVFDEAAPEPSPPRPISAAAVFARDNELAEARLELRLAWLAVPVALLGAWILVHTGMGGFIFRTFFGMWLHELGHATAAWLTGFPAVPLPWFTSVGEERSFLFALAITAGLGYAVWRGWTNDDRLLTAAAGTVLVLQLFGTVILNVPTARTWITFSGGVGSLVFGALLMAAFFVPPDHKLHRDWLRWGFLMIGAASFVDTFRDWWTARHDIDAISLGEIEGVGDTDPTKLLDAGWNVDQLVGRYVAVGVVSLLALVALQVLHVRRTREALEALEAGTEAERRSA
jgi:hypothetical protein